MNAISDLPVKILVVDDERPIRRFLNASLANQYIVEAENGNDAIKIAAIDRPELIILDLGLPDMDGTHVTRQLREWTDVPIIVISVRDSEEDKVAALDAGADDYLTKPFGASELAARIRVALRRSSRTAESTQIFEHDDLLIDFVKRDVRINGNSISLTPTEYTILRTLINHAGKVFTHQQLIKEVWGGNNEMNAHLLRVNISNLRRKIETNPLQPRHIITEAGVGYRFKEVEK
jgi:two-component system KDP operon response regulator KdpE